jgi:hypothetical protein
MGQPFQPTLIVMGMMGRTPFAGVAWQVLHYLEGFRRLGFDVYYVEDTGDWPYDPVRNTISDDCRYTIDFLARMMDWCGLPGKWAYCAAAEGGRVYGLERTRFAGLFERAAGLVNLTGATVLRDEHRAVPRRIYLETDPVLPQIEIARGRSFTIDLLAAHTHHFTFGENLGAPCCGVPNPPQFRYHSTRQPIVLDWWNACGRPGGRFTTIASWQQSGKDVEWNGETYYWSKHHEFLKFNDLPLRSERSFELALACDDEPVLKMLSSHGWRVRDALGLSREILPYRDYIQSSCGEFTVAKDQNIRLSSGWFSDRSACYLAAGRPVITQDTGFGRNLPVGMGLFAFRTYEDIQTALDAIAGDYEGHAAAAREIAGEYFSAEKVLGRLCQLADLS